jgi:hypothetical protein
MNNEPTEQKMHKALVLTIAVIASIGAIAIAWAMVWTAYIIFQ